MNEAEDLRRILAVQTWLSAANATIDQQNGTDVGNENPGTGRWLLTVDKYQSWFNIDLCSTPLLWMNGIPGAGNHY